MHWLGFPVNFDTVDLQNFSCMFGFLSRDQTILMLNDNIMLAAEHHMATPMLTSDSEHDNLAELTTTNESLQPRTTKSSDDQGDDQGHAIVILLQLSDQSFKLIFRQYCDSLADE